jgi:hypothetical protein
MPSPEWISAAAASITTFVALCAAWIAYDQLGELVKERNIAANRERQWRTIDACQGYINSEILERAKTRIWEARSKGQNERLQDVGSVKRDAIFILNYLDGVATGVKQGVYVKEIVRDNLDTIITMAVHDFIENGMGDFGIDSTAFPELIKLANEFRGKTISHIAAP